MTVQEAVDWVHLNRIKVSEFMRNSNPQSWDPYWFLQMEIPCTCEPDRGGHADSCPQAGKLLTKVETSIYPSFNAAYLGCVYTLLHQREYRSWSSYGPHV